MSGEGPVVRPCRGTGELLARSDLRPLRRHRMLVALRRGRIGALDPSSPFRAVESAARRAGLLRRSSSYTFLLSYPRSGNHWLRYAIEVVSGYSTLGASDGFHHRDTCMNSNDPPIHWRIGGRVDYRHPMVVKRHSFRAHDDRSRPVVLVVRDPVEAIASHSGYRSDAAVLERSLRQFERLALQIQRRQGPLHIVRFEDLTGAAEELRVAVASVLDFIGVAGFGKALDRFIADVDAHRAASVAALTRRPISGSRVACSDEAGRVRANVRSELARFRRLHPGALGPFGL